MRYEAPPKSASRTLLAMPPAAVALLERCARERTPTEFFALKRTLLAKYGYGDVDPFQVALHGDEDGHYIIFPN